MSHQEATSLTPLDVSVAFDTRLFIIIFFLNVFYRGLAFFSTALSWIESYLLNRSFYVYMKISKLSVFQLLYGVPQGSVLGPLLFILYITPLSTVTSNSLANLHLYAYDNQNLLSFSSLDFSQYHPPLKHYS